jgi:hypothetical protein
VQNVLTRKIEVRIPMKSVDEPVAGVRRRPDGGLRASAVASPTFIRSISKPRR